MDRIFVIGRDSVPESISVREGETLRATFVVLPGVSENIPVRIDIDGPGAEVDIAGVYVCTGNQKAGVHIDLRHNVGGSVSRQLFKGIVGGCVSGLNGISGEGLSGRLQNGITGEGLSKRLQNGISGEGLSGRLQNGITGDAAQFRFGGLVYVAKDAQKTKAFQENHTILLCEGARVETMPQLEIYADDVECSHGATTGYLREDESFYLRSRGIPEEEARRLQIISFLSPVLSRLPEKLREEVLSVI